MRTGPDRVVVVVSTVAAIVVSACAIVVSLSLLHSDSQATPTGVLETIQTVAPLPDPTVVTPNTSRPVAVPTTHPHTTEALDVCALTRGAVDEMSQLEATNASDLEAELTAIAGRILAAAPRADDTVQVELAALAVLPDKMAEQLTPLDPLLIATDAASAAAIENLVASVPLYFRTIASREGLSLLTPQLVASCDLRSNGVAAGHDMYVFTQAVSAFLETPAGALPRFAGLVDYSHLADHDQRGQTASSELVAEFDECRNDPSAEAPGGHAGCDALYAACGNGDMLACNDLFYSAAVDSAYELFGASCGNRIGSGGEYEWGGFCEGPPET